MNNSVQCWVVGEMIRTLDIFSGIGGMTLAMKDACHPVAYCDIASSCRTVLQCRMQDGSLPTAPICNDVSMLNKAWLIKNNCDLPQVILAGFPCQGFSVIGKKSGFADKRSNMFVHILRLCDELDKPMIFLENSPNLVNHGLHYVTEELSKRGYLLSWTIMSANESGALHKRSRWYGIAHTPSHKSILRQIVSKLHVHNHKWGSEPPRMVLKREIDHTTRLFMLGNSVVPCAVLNAFTKIVLNQTARVLPPTRPLILDPKSFRGKESARQPSQTVITKRLWATPLATSTTASQILTYRNSKLLANQLRFDRDTPNKLRHGWTNPEFVEWLMGYPTGWTCLHNYRH